MEVAANADQRGPHSGGLLTLRITARPQRSLSSSRWALFVKGVKESWIARSASGSRQEMHTHVPRLHLAPQQMQAISSCYTPPVLRYGALL